MLSLALTTQQKQFVGDILVTNRPFLFGYQATMANCTGISTTALILIIIALSVSLISMASNHWSDYELPSTILWVSKYFITISFYFTISKIKALSFSVALFLLKNPKELCTVSVYRLNITHSSMIHPAAPENEKVSLSRK